MTDTDVTLGEIADAEEAVERDEPGAVDRLEALSRRAGFESYAAYQRWIFEHVKDIAQRIKEALGETEIEAIEARIESAESDPVWRAMLRAGKFDETPLIHLVREVRRELITAPNIVPEPAAGRAAESPPQIVNYGTILQAQGDIIVGGDVVNRDKTTNQVIE